MCNQSKTNVTWIIKPRAGCCGNGIKLTQNPFDLAESKVPCIVQNYISPYLVDGYKFDFRLYVCISTLKPYTVFLYKEGLARFCTKKYSPPTRQTLDDKYAHLTNTAINVTNSSQQNTNYTRLASEVMAQISADDVRGKDLWQKIKRAVTLTFVGIYPSIVQSINNVEIEKKAKIRNQYRYVRYNDPDSETSKKGNLPMLKRYFHILGIDIMLNELMDPVVLELNDRPSMHVTFDIEEKLKPQMIYESLSLITTNGNPPDEVNISKNWEKLLPLSSDTPFGRNVNDILGKVKKNFNPRVAMSMRNSVSHSQPKLPPLKHQYQ